MFRGEGKLGFSFQVLKQVLMEIFNILSRGIYERSINLLPFLFFFFLRFGHPDPEGSGRVSRQDCIQMPSYHLKPKSAL